MPLDPLGWTLLDHAALTASGTVHRLGCPRLDGIARLVRPGSTLWRYQAPNPCPDCRPRLDTRLSTAR